VFITHDIAEALKIADRIAIMRDGKMVQIGTPADIVLRPVDDYVREFTKDVVKGRLARIKSVLRPASDAELGAERGADDPGLGEDMTLEDALAACISHYDPVLVWGKDGQQIRVVHPADLAAALRSRVHERAADQPDRSRRAARPDTRHMGGDCRRAHRRDMHAAWSLIALVGPVSRRMDGSGDRMDRLRPWRVS